MSIIRIPQKQIAEPTLTRLAFRRRFTQEELVTIELAKIDDPAATLEQRTIAAHLRVFDKMLSEADYIDVNDPTTQAGVQALEAWGFIAQGRAQQILGA